MKRRFLSLFFEIFEKKFSEPSQSRKARQLGLNLSVTGFAVTAPLVGEPLAGRRVFGVWRFAPFGSAGVMFASAVDDALGASAIRLKNESHAKASPTRGGGIERQR